ncbi:MAG: DUF4115 domain-containing protein, partial [Candidatus Omnitrophica bacterium]|nr:DUF4115 domain-containing protein [Candidatus Omnitrophota bacterium]
ISKGLTLEIVHEATKIPMDALKAIEEGYSTSILTPFYYRGFVKIYAEFLGLKTADVLKEYNVAPVEIRPTVVRQTPKLVTKPTPVTKQKPKPEVAAAVTAPKAPNPFLEQLQEFWRAFWTPQTRKYLLRGLAVVVALFILVKIAGCAVGAIKSFSKHSKTAAVAKTSKTQKAIKKEQPKVEARVDVDEEEQAAKQGAKQVAAQTQSSKVTLAVHASRDMPIQVKADGKIVFQMTMKKGTVENWEAENQIELSGKNLADLDLEVNGKDISSLSSSNRRVRRVVITKEGLTVKK